MNIVQGNGKIDLNGNGYTNGSSYKNGGSKCKEEDLYVCFESHSKFTFTKTCAPSAQFIHNS